MCLGAYEQSHILTSFSHHPFHLCLCSLPIKSYFHGSSLDLFIESVPQANAFIIGTLHDLSQIGFRS